MASQVQGKQLMLANYGITITRAAANLPATTSGNLFAVSGPILLTSLTGFVTTVIQAQANAIKLEAFLTSAAAATDMCATADSNGQAVGKLFGFSGVTTAAATFGFAVPQPNEMIINGPGFIRLNTAATNTGQMSWTAIYLPLVPGATLTAV
jgi:hypothetical protein